MRLKNANICRLHLSTADLIRYLYCNHWSMTASAPLSVGSISSLSVDDIRQKKSIKSEGSMQWGCCNNHSVSSSFPCACEFDRPYPPVPVEWYSPLIFLDHSERRKLLRQGNLLPNCQCIGCSVDCHRGVIWVHESNKGLTP